MGLALPTGASTAVAVDAARLKYLTNMLCTP